MIMANNKSIGLDGHSVEILKRSAIAYHRSKRSQIITQKLQNVV